MKRLVNYDELSAKDVKLVAYYDNVEVHTDKTRTLRRFGTVDYY